MQVFLLALEQGLDATVVSLCLVQLAAPDRVTAQLAEMHRRPLGTLEPSSGNRDRLAEITAQELRPGDLVQELSGVPLVLALVKQSKRLTRIGQRARDVSDFAPCDGSVLQKCSMTGRVGLDRGIRFGLGLVAQAFDVARFRRVVVGRHQLDQIVYRSRRSFDGTPDELRGNRLGLLQRDRALGLTTGDRCDDPQRSACSQDRGYRDHRLSLFR